MSNAVKMSCEDRFELKKRNWNRFQAAKNDLNSELSAHLDLPALTQTFHGQMILRSAKNMRAHSDTFKKLITASLVLTSLNLASGTPSPKEPTAKIQEEARYELLKKDKNVSLQKLLANSKQQLLTTSLKLLVSTVITQVSCIMTTSNYSEG